MPSCSSLLLLGPRRSVTQSAGPFASTKSALIFHFLFRLFSFLRPCALVFGVCFSAEQPRSFRRSSFDGRAKKKRKSPSPIPSCSGSGAFAFLLLAASFGTPPFSLPVCWTPCEHQTRVDLPFSFPPLLFCARVRGFSVFAFRGRAASVFSLEFPPSFEKKREEKKQLKWSDDLQNV